MRVSRRSAATVVAIVALALACDSDDEDTVGPNVASSVTRATGNAQAAVLGDTLADSVAAFVANDRGNGVSGATVTWAVTSGGGSVSPATSVTNAQGIARTRWTLGSGATGENQLTATVDGVAAPATFTATANPRSFSTNLTGQQERPNPVTTPATGTAVFSWNGTQLAYQVTVNNNLTSNVVGAHIHGPQPDSTLNAPIILDLRPPGGQTSGIVAQGTATAQSGQTPVATIPIDSVITLMRVRAAYVNVHTATNPGGEIRGQVKSP
jgi:CHRD domain